MEEQIAAHVCLNAQHGNARQSTAAHVSKLGARDSGMAPANRLVTPIAKLLASTWLDVNSCSRRGMSTLLGTSGNPGTSWSSCWGMSSQICKTNPSRYFSTKAGHVHSPLVLPVNLHLPACSAGKHTAAVGHHAATVCLHLPMQYELYVCWLCLIVPDYFLYQKDTFRCSCWDIRSQVGVTEPIYNLRTRTMFQAAATS